MTNANAATVSGHRDRYHTIALSADDHHRLEVAEGSASLDGRSLATGGAVVGGHVDMVCRCFVIDDTSALNSQSVSWGVTGLRRPGPYAWFRSSSGRWWRWRCTADRRRLVAPRSVLAATWFRETVRRCRRTSPVCTGMRCEVATAHPRLARSRSRRSRHRMSRYRSPRRSAAAC